MIDTTRDERMKRVSPLRRALIRPELGGICGTILVFMLFGAIAGDSGMFTAEGVNQIFAVVLVQKTHDDVAIIENNTGIGLARICQAHIYFIWGGPVKTDSELR